MSVVTELLAMSPVLAIFVIFAYFIKLYIEKKIDNVNERVNSISQSSLDIKQELRSEERQALVDFRVAIESWEDLMFGCLTDFSTTTITSESINKYYNKERELQLSVKKALAKISVLSQNEDIYSDSLGIIISISHTYNPFINKYLPKLIDMHTAMEPINFRSEQFNRRMTNGEEIQLTPEQAKQDQENSRAIQSQLTELIQQYSEELLEVYPKLAEQLTDLKISMNQQVYRRMSSDKIDEN